MNSIQLKVKELQSEMYFPIILMIWLKLVDSLDS